MSESDPKINQDGHVEGPADPFVNSSESLDALISAILDRTNDLGEQLETTNTSSEAALNEIESRVLLHDQSPLRNGWPLLHPAKTYDLIRSQLYVPFTDIPGESNFETEKAPKPFYVSVFTAEAIRKTYRNDSYSHSLDDDILSEIEFIQDLSDWTDDMTNLDHNIMTAIELGMDEPTVVRLFRNSREVQDYFSSRMSIDPKYGFSRDGRPADVPVFYRTIVGAEAKYKYILDQLRVDPGT
jgi:hypothetical protein